MKIKRLTKTAILPKKGSKEAAGIDLYVDCDYTTRIEPHSTHLFKTGLAFEIPDGYFGGVYIRSGIGVKQDIRPSNCVGIVDSDYRGEVMIKVINDNNEPQYIPAFSRIAQMIIQPYLPVTIEDAEELSETERGNNGFGSTGVE